MNVFPNRTYSETQIAFTADGGPIAIRLVDASGRVVSEITRDRYPRGQHQITWNMSPFSAGLYYVQIITPSGKQAKRLIKL